MQPGSQPQSDKLAAERFNRPFGVGYLIIPDVFIFFQLFFLLPIFISFLSLWLTECRPLV